MNRKVFIFILIIGFVSGYSAYQALKLDQKLSKSTPFDSNNIIKLLPDVEFTELFNSDSSSSIKASSFLGSGIVLIHFWATWCIPCIKELPEFIEFAKAMNHNASLKILAISVDDKDRDVKKFFRDYHIMQTDKIIWLSDKKGANRYFGSYKLPETFIFDSKGTLLKKFSGTQKWQDESFLKYLKSL